MPKTNTNTPQPQSVNTDEDNRGQTNQTVREEMTGDDASENGSEDVTTDTETVVAFKPRATNKFAKLASSEANALASKASIIAEAKKELKATHEIAAKEGEAAKAAMGPANAAALLLYRGLCDGALDTDTVTDLLGAEFGYKVKKSDGQPSKTPAGYGEEIRKRVQRAFKAYDYAVNGNEPVAFYEPLERDDIKPFVTELKAGKQTLFGFYDAIGKFKSTQMGTRPKAAFDPRRWAALTRDLLGDVKATVETVTSTPGLEAALMGAWRALSIIGQELPEEEGEAVEAA